MAQPGFPEGPTLCIITGASRGLGRAIACELRTLISGSSRLLLVARSESALRDLSAHLDAVAVPADLSTAAGRQVLESAILDISPSHFHHVLLFSNAGSLGDVSKFVADLSNPGEIESFLSFNVVTPAWLSGLILRHFPPKPDLRRTLVNISSLCAKEPFPSWSLYCTAKAANDMLFRVIAAENPDVRVLNYAPGPLDTNMQFQARTQTGDLALRCLFLEKSKQGELVRCDTSAHTLLQLIALDEFQSGSHIDFYDLKV
uniref:sepiapterin reductase n=1 Tax=Myxine glutinosa TaxID=7769 RepID=UPI00358F8FD1